MSEASPRSLEELARTVNALQEQLQSLGVEGAGLPPTGPTLGKLMNQYMDYARARYGGEQSSEVWDFRGAFRILGALHGRRRAREFGPKAFQQMRDEMIDAGWSRRYINEQCHRVKRFIAWCVANEELPPHARSALDTVSGLRLGDFGLDDPAPIRPVDDAMINATVRKLRPTVADMVRVARLTGMRPGEVCQLAGAYIDTSTPVWLFNPPLHKMRHKHKTRTVAIGPQAQAILAKYLDREPTERFFRPSDSEVERRAAQHAARKTPVGYGNGPGKNRKTHPKFKPGPHYTAQTFRKAIHRACDKAFPPPRGLTPSDRRDWRSEHRWSPNRLRHTFATEVRKQFGIEAAQALLGHTTTDMTEVYAERNMATAAEIAAKIG